MSASAEPTGVPATFVITSPATRPALAAPPPLVTEAIFAPMLSPASACA